MLTLILLLGLVLGLLAILAAMGLLLLGYLVDLAIAPEPVRVRKAR